MTKRTSPVRKLYPAAECRELLGIGKTFFYVLVRRNELEIIRLGRRSYVTAEAIDGLISRSRRPVSRAK
jgi:excisionase family DNA binding protein